MNGINPILLRELRQMVRNRLVLWVINLYLFAQVSLSWGVMFATLQSSAMLPIQFGLIVFVYYLGITTIATLIATVGYTALRIVVDRSNEDLLFYTTLSPGAIVRGRLICGLVIGILFFSMSMPFLVFTYLLRGSDIRYYLLIPLAFLAVQILNLVALAVFSAARSYLQAAFYFLLFVAATGLVVFGWWGIGSMIWEIIDEWTRISYWLGHRAMRSWMSHLFYPIGGLIFVTVIWTPITAYLFARCNLSPYAANRMYPIRRWFSWVMGVTLVICFAEYPLHEITWLKSWGEPLLYYWLTSIPYLLAAMLVVAVCERETWEGRLRRSIPTSMFRRLLVFPNYTGSVNGLLWGFLWTVVLIVVFSWQSQSNFVNSFGLIWGMQLLIFLILVFDYSMTAYFLWRGLFHRWVPRDMIWMLAVGLLIAVSFTTFFVTYLMRATFNLEHIENGVLLAANPFVVILDRDFGIHQSICAMGWLSLLVLFGYPWLRNRFLDFRNENE